MDRFKIGYKMRVAIRVLIGLITIWYAVYAFYLLILGSRYRYLHIGLSRFRFSHNFVPFKTISIYLFNPYHLSWGIIFDNLIGNILVFMPLGFLVPFYSKKMRKTRYMIILSFFLSVSVEMTQGFLGVGSIDVDDVILNTLGGFVGYCFYLIIYKVCTLLFDWKPAKSQTPYQ